MDSIQIALGKMLQTPSGATNGGVNLAFRYFGDNYDPLNNACDVYDTNPNGVTVTDTASGTTYTATCGGELVKVYKKFLTVQVPSF